MARVSVIVPTFNRVGYLGETIASILHQDYRDFELVVADNASTDATAALLAGSRGPAPAPRASGAQHRLASELQPSAA